VLKYFHILWEKKLAKKYVQNSGQKPIWHDLKKIIAKFQPKHSKKQLFDANQKD
jgi:hypothetical protein